MPAAPEEKAARAYIDASSHRLFNPYQYADIIRLADGYAAEMLRHSAIAVFRLGEIEYRYGIGDPEFGEMSSRICAIIDEYYPAPQQRT